MNIYEAGPGRKLVEITKSDSTELDPDLRALWIGGDGDLSILCWGQSAAVTISGVVAGTLLPIKARKVMAATTATNIVGII